MITKTNMVIASTQGERRGGEPLEMIQLIKALERLSTRGGANGGTPRKLHGSDKECGAAAAHVVHSAGAREGTRST